MEASALPILSPFTQHLNGLYGDSSVFFGHCLVIHLERIGVTLLCLILAQRFSYDMEYLVDLG